jgi:hypothetical protein
MLLWSAIPEIWTKPIAFHDIPVPFFLTQILACSLAAEQSPKHASKRSSDSPLFWLLIISCVYSVGRGLALYRTNNWQLKFFAVDLWMVECLILGMIWARRRTLESAWEALKSIAPTLLLIACGTCVGVLAGIVTPLNNNEYHDRFYTYSLWDIGYISVLAWPLFHLYSTEIKRVRDRRSLFRSRVYSILMLASAFVVALFTATRSTLIVAALALVAGILLSARHSARQLLQALLLLSVAAVVIAAVASQIKLKGSSVIDRLAQTDVQSEVRWSELSGMFQQLGDDWSLGWGMGSLFDSPVGGLKDPYADSPHIGITTFLLKGGLIMFLPLVVVPLYLSVRGLLRSNSTANAGGLCVALYLTLACISGGWIYFEILFLGIGLGLLLQSAPQGLRRGSVRARPRMAYESPPSN